MCWESGREGGREGGREMVGGREGGRGREGDGRREGGKRQKLYNYIGLVVILVFLYSTMQPLQLWYFQSNS